MGDERPRQLRQTTPWIFDFFLSSDKSRAIVYGLLCFQPKFSPILPLQRKGEKLRGGGTYGEKLRTNAGRKSETVCRKIELMRTRDLPLWSHWLFRKSELRGHGTYGEKLLTNAGRKSDTVFRKSELMRTRKLRMESSLAF